jgi:cytochrome c553
MKALLTLMLASLFALSLPVMARGNIEKGKKLAAEKACASCHGADYKSPTSGEFPILAGQHYDYLVVALRSYQRPDDKSLGRKNAMMQGFAQQLSGSDIQDLAAYLSSLPGPLVLKR